MAEAKGRSNVGAYAVRAHAVMLCLFVCLLCVFALFGCCFVRSPSTIFSPTQQQRRHQRPPPTHTHKQNHPQTPQPPPPPPPQDVLERISVCARVLLDPESLLLVKDTLLSKCRESFAAFLRFKNGGLWRVCV